MRLALLSVLIFACALSAEAQHAPLLPQSPEFLIGERGYPEQICFAFVRCEITDAQSEHTNRDLRRIDIDSGDEQWLMLARVVGNGDLLDGAEEELEVIALLGSVWHESHAWPELDLVRLGEVSTSSGGSGFFAESRESFTKTLDGFSTGWTRRVLSVCLEEGEVFECTQLPLEFTSWTAEIGAETRTTTFSTSWTARAIAVIRQDGSIRLTLQRGSWNHLYGGGWFDPWPGLYPTHGRVQIVDFEGMTC